MWNLQPSDPMQNKFAITCVLLLNLPFVLTFQNIIQTTNCWGREGDQDNDMEAGQEDCSPWWIWWRKSQLERFCVTRFIIIWFDCLFVGYDLALMQLYPVVKDNERFPKLKPVCLPFKNMAPSGDILAAHSDSESYNSF